MTKIIYPDLSYQVQGALFEVYNELQHFDLSEAGWEKALILALGEREVCAHQQAEYELHYKVHRNYKVHRIGRFFVDVLADERLLLELKVREKLLPIDVAQVITYLKVTGLKLGILVNFGGDRLEFRRVPNFTKQPTPPGPTVAAVQGSSNLLYPELTNQLRAILYEVHRELGPGFMHMHYRRATQIELRLHDIPYQVKKHVTIRFRGEGIEKLDTRLLVVDDRVLVAPIAVREISPRLRGRFCQYAKLLDLRLGLIANFHKPSLQIETVRI